MLLSVLSIPFLFNSIAIVTYLSLQFKIRLTLSMIIDFGGCYVIEKTCKFLFADLEPKEMVTRGRERREARRAEQERLKQLGEAEEKLAIAAGEKQASATEKKSQ